MDNTKELPSILPILPLVEKPLFPGTLTTMIIGRPEDVNIINSVIEGDGFFIALLELDGNKIGTICKINKFLRLPNNCIHAFVSTLQRVEVKDEETREDGKYGSWSDVEDNIKVTKALMPYVRVLKDAIVPLTQTQLFNMMTEVNINNIEDPSELSFFVASSLNGATKEFLLDILTDRSAKSRIEKLISYVEAEKEVLGKENEIKNELAIKIKNKNKEILLREQIKALQGELNALMGNNAQAKPNDIKLDIYDEANQKELPENYREVVNKELEKLSGTDPSNPEYMLTKLYIETILSLPFSFDVKAPDYSISDVKAQLEKDHYGMKEVKERIVEFLASRLKAKNSNGAIICLAGPPGVGKTSVGYSIAAALNRKFYRFSVGGMRDEAEIKGHRRTYVGAMPGKIIQGMKTTGVVDPVFLIDEIDKMGESFHGDPASALLEVLDPEQNSNFQDFYLNMPYDLSKVLFIVTANDISKIPSPLLDRMEIIELSGYTPQEKLHIGSKYLVPKLLEKNGLDKKELKFSNKALSIIAEEYAREAGVRHFEKSIDKIMRKVALEILESKYDEQTLPITIKEKDVEKYLGKPIFPSDDILSADNPGTAIGLAWTEMGGDVLLIEAEGIPGKGELKITGQLGDVMKESVAIAWSSLKKEAYLRGLDTSYFDNTSVHIHIPDGAVPKDGPSAGITLFTALWSMFRNIKMKDHMAMTGELTLTGRVTPIGGLKEKILAARRNGIKEIIIPARNKTDLDKLSEEVKGSVIFYPVKDISEVISLAFPSEQTKRLDVAKLTELNEAKKHEADLKRQEENLEKAEAFQKVFKWQ